MAKEVVVAVVVVMVMVRGGSADKKGKDFGKLFYAWSSFGARYLKKKKKFETGGFTLHLSVSLRGNQASFIFAVVPQNLIKSFLKLQLLPLRISRAESKFSFFRYIFPLLLNIIFDVRKRKTKAANNAFLSSRMKNSP